MRLGIKLASCGDTELGVLFSNCVVILTHEERVVFGGDIYIMMSVCLSEKSSLLGFSCFLVGFHGF